MRLRFGRTLMLLAVCVPAFSQNPKPPYTRLYVFGDSYSDSGAGYVDTNGPTAVVVLAQKLGIPFTYAGDPQATPDEGLNYAVSGAQTGPGGGKHYKGGAFLSYGMRNQVDDFAKAVRERKIRFDPKQTIVLSCGRAER